MDRRLFFKAFPVLETENLVLRKMTIKDSVEMFRYASDELTTRFVSWTTHETIEDSKLFIKFSMKMLKDGHLLNWAITLKGDDRFIGSIGFGSFDEGSKRAEIGYWLGKEYWDRGIMTEALKEVINFGFEVLELNRIQCTHVIENNASGKVMEKAGMSFEGILKEYLFFKDKFWDIKMYSVVREKI